MKKLRELNGVLLLDKPPGLTSNSALQRVKRLFNAKHIKVGHTGSLDPLATGMLPICFGEATKFSGFLLNADKKYLVTMQLGVKTDTGDLDGSIIATDDNSKTYDFTELHINKVLTGFLGEISQIPPIYSATASVPDLTRTTRRSTVGSRGMSASCRFSGAPIRRSTLI